MPHEQRFRERLLAFKDFTKFPRWDARQMEDLDRLIAVDIPKLMALVGGVSASGLQERRCVADLTHREKEGLASGAFAFGSDAGTRGRGGIGCSCCCWAVVMLFLC